MSLKHTFQVDYYVPQDVRMHLALNKVCGVVCLEDFFFQHSEDTYSMVNDLPEVTNRREWPDKNINSTEADERI